jgi:glycosyltransferase involved in cell wall biosynthesis
VQTAHGTWAVEPFRSTARRLFFGPALRRVDLLVCQSRATRERMAALVTLPPHVVRPAGVRVEPFAVSPREPAAWPGRGPVVLMVGAVKRRKGTHLAVEALAEVRHQHPSAALVVVGNLDAQPEYRADVQRRAAALGVGDAVHWLGRVPFGELVAWYQRADVVIAPSVDDAGRFEGFGLAVVEAAAAGTPAIGTFGCGLADAIADGETGLLVPPDDIAAVAAALDRLLGDEALRRRMGERARAHAAAFSWRRFAETMTGEYRRLLGLRPRAPRPRAAA